MDHKKNVRISPLGIYLKRLYKKKIIRLIESPNDPTATKITFSSRTIRLVDVASVIKGYHTNKGYVFNFKVDGISGSVIVGSVCNENDEELFQTSITFIEFNSPQIIMIREYHKK